jgi:hypothetical protein
MADQVPEERPPDTSWSLRGTNDRNALGSKNGMKRMTLLIAKNCARSDNTTARIWGGSSCASCLHRHPHPFWIRHSIQTVRRTVIAFWGARHSPLFFRGIIQQTFPSAPSKGTPSCEFRFHESSHVMMTLPRTKRDRSLRKGQMSEHARGVHLRYMECAIVMALRPCMKTLL